MKYKKKLCSPKSLKENKGSCINRELMEKIAKILNNNPNCEKMNTDSDSLYDEISYNMKNVFNCNSEYCWITISDIVNNLSSDDVEDFKSYFRPLMPKSWKNDINEWLSTSDIDNVLEQYEESDENFKYLGAHPIDAHKCSVSEEVCKIDLCEFLDNNIHKIGIVFNTDTSDGDGEHWVSFYIDLNGINRDNPSAYFFDSTGDRPQKQIYNLVKKLKKQCKKKDINLDFIWNDIKHQRKDTECGIYCLYFITQMLKGKNFDSYVEDIKKDEFMEKYRKIFYMNI